MYAVIEDSGTQILVSEGDIIRVDRRDLAEDQLELRFDRVLMIGGREGLDPSIGRPYVPGSTVTGEILAEERSEKVRVVKFKKRKNYLRQYGHRQDLLRLQITGIEAGG